MKRILVILILIISISSAGTVNAFFGSKRPVKLEDVEGDRKVLVVEIYAKWCPLCRNIQPTIDILKKEIPDINVVQLDVSNKEKAEESYDIAEKMGIENYYLANKSKTGSVGILVASTRQIVKVLNNSNDIDEYKIAIQEAKTLEKSLEKKPEKD